jgi:hypothetical protein
MTGAHLLPVAAIVLIFVVIVFKSGWESTHE